MDWLYYEKLYSGGTKKICGIDEAGRGPLAGPVCAAAVILPSDVIIEGVNDSKKLSAKKRDYLYDIIIEKALCYCVSSASVDEIDSLNILNATFLAMKRAVQGLKIKPSFALVDGNICPDLDMNAKAIIKGDSLSESIACASILAKVTRDRFMTKEAEKYPEYQFERHKGYGTKLHIDMIKKHGPSLIHRKTFLKRILEHEHF